MTTIPDTRLIFAADIGATNSRFALFEARPYDSALPLLSLVHEQWLKGAEYRDFPEVLQTLLDRAQDREAPLIEPGRTPEIAVLAPAGPIQRDEDGPYCRISNLPWTVRARDVTARLGIARVHLINDFAAQAYACLSPESVDTVEVLPGAAVPGAPLAVAGAGTGFGVALLLCDAPQAGEQGKESREAALDRFQRARVLSAEGGHAEFPFVGAEEFAFAEFAGRRSGTPRLIGDSIVSGTGLAHLVAWFTGGNPLPHEATALAPDCPEALEWFARFYARACRNYVLNTLALGGLFVTAGMALRVPVLQHPAFAEEFHNSAAQRRLLENLPVRHVQKPQAGLWGAALFGLLRLLHAEQ